jgi:hypothetical protein
LIAFRSVKSLNQKVGLERHEAPLSRTVRPFSPNSYTLVDVGTRFRSDVHVAVPPFLPTIGRRPMAIVQRAPGAVVRKPPGNEPAGS